MLFGLGSVTISTEIYLLCAGPICHSSFYKIFELFDIFEKNLFIQKGECDSRWSSLGGILGPNWPISVVPLVARDSAVHPRQPDEKGQKLWTIFNHGTAVHPCQPYEKGQSFQQFLIMGLSDCVLKCVPSKLIQDSSDIGEVTCWRNILVKYVWFGRAWVLLNTNSEYHH